MKFKNKEINYTLKGEGKKVVLLHGYLEDHTVWGAFAERLEKEFRVLNIDLLGHGKSEIVEDISSMKLQAEMVKHVMNKNGFDKAVVVGHSMGGYTGLAILEYFPEILNGFCLFHSHPFADSEQARNNRNRELNLIHSDKKKLLIHQSIPNMFAEKNRELCADKINTIIKTAENFPNQGIQAALLGMKQRPDRSRVLLETKVPILYIWGADDKFVTKEAFDKIKFPPASEILILENSGHCGFYEEEKKSFNKIKEFLMING